MSSAPTALAHDQLVLLCPMFARGTHHDGLQDTNLAHRVDELLHLLLIEIGSRLLAVGVNIAHIELSKLSAGHRHQVRLILLICTGHRDIFAKEEIHRAAGQGRVAQGSTHIDARLFLRCFT